MKISLPVFAVLVSFVFTQMIPAPTKRITLFDAVSYADDEKPYFHKKQMSLKKKQLAIKQPVEKWLDEIDALKKPPAEHLSFYKESHYASDNKREVINEIGRFYGIPDDVLYYQHHIESRGLCPKRENSKGAVGCFQFLTSTGKEFGLVTNGKDYRSNLFASADAAARYLTWLAIIMYGNKADLSNWEQLRHVLAAYNAGYGRVIKEGKPRIPRFIETLEYVKNIESLVKGEAILVRKGDTLESLSKNSGVSIEFIMRSNPTVSGTNDLKYGQVINLPDHQGMSSIIVKKGMSLYALEKGTGVSVKSIVEANKLYDGNVIHIGETLKIPVAQGVL